MQAIKNWILGFILLFLFLRLFSPSLGVIYSESKILNLFNLIPKSKLGITVVLLVINSVSLLIIGKVYPRYKQFSKISLPIGLLLLFMLVYSSSIVLNLRTTLDLEYIVWKSYLVRVAVFFISMTLIALLLPVLIDSAEKMNLIVLYPLLFFALLQSVLGIAGVFFWRLGEKESVYNFLGLRTPFFYNVAGVFEHNLIRATGTFVNPNTFAAFLVMVLPICGYLYREEHDKFIKTFITLSSLILILAIFFSYSRAGFVCLLVYLISLGLYFRVNFQLFIKSGKLLLYSGVIIFLLFIFPKLTQRVVSIFNFYDPAVTNRLLLWKGTINMIADFWFRGIGVGNFAILFNRFYRPSLLAKTRYPFPEPHSAILGIFADTGIAGGLIFFTLLLLLIYSAFKKKDEKIFFITLPVLGWAIMSIFDSINMVSVLNICLFIILGILFYQYLNSPEQEQKITLNKYFILFLLLLKILFLIFNLRALPSPKEMLTHRLKRRAAQFRGDAGISILNLNTGEEININSDRLYKAASVIKLPILYTILKKAERKELSLEDKISLKNVVKTPGSGVLYKLDFSEELKIIDLLRLAIIWSDNIAANVLIDIAGGIDSINKTMKELGLEEIQLKGYFGIPNLGSKGDSSEWGVGVMTPKTCTKLLAQMWKEAKEGNSYILEGINIMRQSTADHRLRRYLPEVEVANKSGSLSDVRNDVGIITYGNVEYVISVFCQDILDKSWSYENEAVLFIADISKMVFDYMLCQNWTEVKNPLANIF